MRRSVENDRVEGPKCDWCEPTGEGSITGVAGRCDRIGAKAIKWMGAHGRTRTFWFCDFHWGMREDMKPADAGRARETFKLIDDLLSLAPEPRAAAQKRAREKEANPNV